MNELALFAGAGGGILGGRILGFRTVAAVEFDAYCASVLLARQNDGTLPPFPIWDDVRTFDGAPWRGRVEVVSGGFPCQDISVAGKGAGLAGERSGLWRQMVRIIGEVRPLYVYVENAAVLTSRGLGVVLGDLAELGFDAAWRVLSAGDLGACHERERIWIVAHAHGVGQLQPQGCKRHQWRWPGDCSEEDGDALRSRLPEREALAGELGEALGRLARDNAAFPGRWPAEPDVARMVHGLARRVDRVKALGNGQVPRVAAAAFTELSRALAEGL